MPEYYDLDRAKLSLRELRRLSPGLIGFHAAVFLKCGLIPSFSKQPLVRPEGIRRLGFDQFSIEARRDLQPAIDATIAAGLRLQFHYQSVPENEFTPADVTWAIAFLSTDQRFWAVLAWVRVRRSHVTRQRSIFLCRSLLITGEKLITVDRRPLYDPPDHASIERIVDGSPQVIVDLHLRRLQGVAPDQIVRVTPDELERVLVEQSQELFNELQRRGLLRPLEGR